MYIYMGHYFCINKQFMLVIVFLIYLLKVYLLCNIMTILLLQTISFFVYTCNWFMC